MLKYYVKMMKGRHSMKSLKKILALILVCSMVFAFTACTMGATANTGVTSTGYTSDQVDAMLSNLKKTLTALIDENSSDLVQLSEEFNTKITALEEEDEKNANAIAAAKKDYEEKIAALDSKIAALGDEKNEAGTDYTEELAALEAKDGELSKAIADLKTAYESKVKDIDSKIAALEEEKGEAGVDYGEKITALEAKDTELAKEISDLKTAYESKVTELEGKIAELEEARTEAGVDYTEELEALDSAITSNTNAISTLSGDINNLKEKIAELESAGGEENTAEIAELESSIAALEEEITLLKAKDTELNTKIDNLKADYEAKDSELAGKITECNNAITAAKTDFDGKLDVLDDKIEANTALIEAHKTAYNAKVAAIEDRIDALEEEQDDAKCDCDTELSELTAKVDSNTAAISAHKDAYEAKILEIEGKIAALEQEKGSASTDYSEEIADLQTQTAEIYAELETLKSTYGARIKALEDNAGALAGIDATLTEAGKAADAKAVGDAIGSISSSVAALNSLLATKPVYGYVYTTVDTTSEEAQARAGKFLSEGGTVASATGNYYNYTNPIEVKPGDVIHLTGYYMNKPNVYQSPVSMRMGCVYDAQGKPVSSLGFNNTNSIKEYVIKDGSASIAVTYPASTLKENFVLVLARYTVVGQTFILSDDANSASVVKALVDLEAMKTDVEKLQNDVASLDAATIQELAANVVELNAKIDALDVDKLNETVESIKNLDVNGLNIITNAALGSSSIHASADKLIPGVALNLEKNTQINNKNLTFTCDISEEGLGEGRIRLGHGKTEYAASYLEITSTQIIVYNKYTDLTAFPAFTHGLTLSGYVTVSIDVDTDHMAAITLQTATGNYTCSKNWAGRNGKIFAEVEGCEVTNVNMRWFCEDYQNPIWMVGDSYFNSTDGSRWTSYLIKNNYKRFLMMSYPGMASTEGLAEVEQALTHGTPQYIVWCMGMNNPDSGTSVNAAYLDATEKFLAICEEKGIIPILSTIPSTPRMLNEPKNAWVREWARTTGGRYIDFARAVSDQTYNASLIGTAVTGTSTTSPHNNTTGYQWYENMLHGDAVHPATLGAKALYMQFLVDFPEIMREK